MAIAIERRQFISGLSSAAATWPLAARAQQSSSSVKRVGVLQVQPENDADFHGWRTLFAARLKELGWTDGDNLRIEYRFGSGEVASIAPVAKELVDLQPDAIFAITALSAITLRQYTLAIPTVFVQVGDPVSLGLVTNLARPNGNITGFTSSDFEIGSKWIETLKDTVPNLTWTAIFFEAGNPSSTQYILPIEAAAAKLNLRLIPVPVQSVGDLDAAFASFTDLPKGAFIMAPVGIVIRQRKAIIDLAAQKRLPGIYPYRYIVAEGGLMSYGSNIGNQYQAAASYIDRILRGAKPADLPVQQPTKFDLVINLKTAKALGLTVPQSILARADEVIE
jgi:putative tryptophan/tyrosine transport system substrate-binding protein